MNSRVPLRRLTTMTYGDALPDALRRSGDVPVISSGGVTGLHDKENTRTPAIVIGRKGSHGSTWWSERAAFVIDTAYYVDERNTNLDLRWLYYVMQSADLSALTNDVGVPGLSRELAYKALVPAPPNSNEQRRIADFLDDQVPRIDNIIAARQQQAHLILERWRETRRLVIRGLDRSAPADDAGGWLGPLAAGFQPRRIGSLARVYAGAGFPIDDQGVEAGEYPYMKVSDLAAADARAEVRSSRNFVDRETARRLGAKPAPPETIVFPKVGAALLTNRRAILAVEAVFDNNVMGLHFFGAHPRFMLHVLRDLDLALVSNPGPVPSVNESTIKDIRVPVPGHHRQESITRRLDEESADMEMVLRVLETAIVLLQELKRSLISAAVSGEFDVSTASGRGVPE